MPIQRLVAKNFRNLVDIEINNLKKFNLFYGENGSGKTSLLESIYYLNRCRSFRTNYPNRIINHDQEQFTVFAEYTHHKIVPIGVERYQDGSKRIRIDNQDVPNATSLIKLFPVLFMSTKSYLFFTEGPKLRRQYLDWGGVSRETRVFRAMAASSTAIKAKKFSTSL